MWYPNIQELIIHGTSFLNKATLSIHNWKISDFQTRVVTNFDIFLWRPITQPLISHGKTPQTVIKLLNFKIVGLAISLQIVNNISSLKWLNISLNTVLWRHYWGYSIILNEHCMWRHTSRGGDEGRKKRANTSGSNRCQVWVKFWM